MRILSRSTDYFDFSGMGVDPSVVFLRDEQCGDRLTSAAASDLAASFPRGSVDALSLPDTVRASWRDAQHGWVALSIQPGFVLVGGIGIPFVRFFLAYDWSDHPIEQAWCFATPDLKKALAGYTSRMGYAQRDAAVLVHQMDPVFSKGHHDLTPYALALHAVTGVLLAEHRPRRADPSFAYEPKLLKDTGVQDHLPPHEAHMMVSRFVGGVMANNPPVAPLSNTDRVVKAGFDLVTSFRKGPTKTVKA